ncbi:hypothetical protein MLD38_024412 [Melastoma candidum]|uniref:Uncharacterized protein n=1 Tax=Melastoma candidum TaxID=119954 RepID=A0ACB9NV79_9MYRT|nr:hypothetical protein MLD38_024412 [Melastoma candidum]
MAHKADLFDSYFQRADLDRDGRISGAEAVSFFQASGLPKQVLAKVWDYADQNRTGFLGRAEFYNALRLVTVAQSKRELTPELVKAALYGPAAAKIPAPQMNLPGVPTSQLNNTAARPVSQTGLGNTVSSQNVGLRGPQQLPAAIPNQRQYMPQPSQILRPSQPLSTSSSVLTQVVSPQGFPNVSASVGQRPPAPGISGSLISGGPVPYPATAQVPNSGVTPTTTHAYGVTAPGGMVSLPPRPHVAPSVVPSGTSVNDGKKLNVPSNGLAADSIFGNVFSTTQPPRQEPPATNAQIATSATFSASPAPQPVVHSNILSAYQSSEALQPISNLTQAAQSAQRVVNQRASNPTTSDVSFSTVSPLLGKSSTSQPQNPWPKMTQTDVQKYMRVFVEVDKDKDGKITGGEARNLFLSWKLPRDILKQVWDLSDQDNDSMLSLREFCVALYLMERHREGHTLPSVLPSNLILDLPTASQPTVGHANAAWVHSQGWQQHRGKAPPASQYMTIGARGKPPRPPVGPLAEEPQQPVQPKAKIPVLEKPLMDQLSTEEQNSLNSKLQEAVDADKKVQELEKEITDSRQKMEFYRAKMQELVLYKSRCDNRLNEIIERASGDKREVESLSKRYEEKCRQVGDVASKLTIEEATFRDVQEKKMEVYRAILNMEKDGKTDGALQVLVDRIQEDLDELVKVLNDRCKKYGLRAKPTSLLELPFGWQPGVQEAAADWDEDWDKFQEEGYTFVKEFTLDVQNVVAPPKEKSLCPVKKTVPLEGQTDPSITAKQTDPSSPHAEVNKEGPFDTDGHVMENGVHQNKGENGTPRSAPESPATRSSTSSPRGSPHPTFGKNSFESSALFDRDVLSDHETSESVHSGDRTFDEPAWGASENDDLDSVWGLNAASSSPWEIDHDRLRDDSFLSGSKTDFGLNPIRTGSQHDTSSPRRTTFFDESVPSTPLYTPATQSGSQQRSLFFDESVPSTPLYTSGTQPQRSSVFFDESVPSTPLYSSVFSPSYREQSGPSFDSSSRFDSFNSRDGSSFFSQPETLARFDSMRSSRDFDQGHSFPSFDDADPFGTGPFKTSGQTPRSSDHWDAFS